MPLTPGLLGRSSRLMRIRIDFRALVGAVVLCGALLGLVVGCATEDRINKVSAGMSKAQVIAAMGNPSSTAGEGETEYLNYNLLVRGPLGGATPIQNQYFVRLRNGKVDAYGRKGDFNSTKDPTQNVNLNIKTE